MRVRYWRTISREVVRAWARAFRSSAMLASTTVKEAGRGGIERVCAGSGSRGIRLAATAAVTSRMRRNDFMRSGGRMRSRSMRAAHESVAEAAVAQLAVAHQFRPLLV